MIWDDSTYIHDNPYLHSINSSTLWWMPTDSVGPNAHYNWQPLTALSHAIDLQLWASTLGCTGSVISCSTSSVSCRCSSAIAPTDAIDAALCRGRPSSPAACKSK